MGGFRTFTENAKKFSPKQHRTCVGAMSCKQCPLHDLKRNRPCKQSVNPHDVCPHFKPGRSRHACTSQPAQHQPTSHLAPHSTGLLLMTALDRRSAAAPVPSVPARFDGTDHLPETGVEYGVGTFRGVQPTIAGGLIRPPSAEPEAQVTAEIRLHTAHIPGCDLAGCGAARTL